MVLVRRNTARPCTAWERGRLAREPHPGWKRRRLGGRSPVPLSRPRAAHRLGARASRRSISRPPVSPACRAPPGSAGGSPACRAPPGGAGGSPVALPDPCLAREPHTAWEGGRLGGRSPRPLSRPRAAHRLGGWASRPRAAPRLGAQASRRSISRPPVSPVRRTPPGGAGVSPACRYAAHHRSEGIVPSAAPRINRHSPACRGANPVCALCRRASGRLRI